MGWGDAGRYVAVADVHNAAGSQHALMDLDTEDAFQLLDDDDGEADSDGEDGEG